MSIMTATYHGYVRLDPSVVANFISSYYFSQAAEKTVRIYAESKRNKTNKDLVHDTNQSLWTGLYEWKDLHQARRYPE
jgi:hypothetical protein